MIYILQRSDFMAEKWGPLQMQGIYRYQWGQLPPTLKSLHIFKIPLKTDIITSSLSKALGFGVF